jgi:hypothetical protein
MTHYTPAPIPSSTGPKPRSLRIVVAAVALVAAVVAAGAAVILLGGEKEPAGPPAQAASNPPQDPTSNVDEAAPDGVGEPLTEAPATEWISEGGVLVPVSREFGPASVDERGVPSTFAHSPEGALFAAAQITARTGAAFPASVRQAVTAACVTGEADDVAAFAETVAKAEPISAAQASMTAAFDYLAYTPEEALVELVMDAGAEGVYAAFRIAVVWTGEDWALQAPMNGDWNTAVRPVDDLDIFVPWGP